MKISNRNTVQIRNCILNFITVWTGYDDIGSTTGPDDCYRYSPGSPLPGWCPELDTADSGQGDKS